MTIEIKVQETHERKQMTHMQRWRGWVDTSIYGDFVCAEEKFKTPGKAIEMYAG